MNRAEKAKDLFKQGYNCAQSVFLAFNDLTKIDEDTAKKISAPFGGGMGRLREVCGAFSGMVMVLGLVFYQDSGSITAEKTSLYKREHELAEKFRERNGNLVCRDLLKGVKTEGSAAAEERTEKYYKVRPCVEIVANAAEILEEYLKKHGIDC